jgi:hypothetical protein
MSVHAEHMKKKKLQETTPKVTAHRDPWQS